MDDAVLIAYVDGELPPHERHEVERKIAASPELAERVAHLEASRLPYREAFAQQKLPPVPEHLARAIEDMARAHAAKQADANANDAAVGHTHPSSSVAVRSRLRVAPAWLAVAFVAGAFISGAILRFAPGAPGAQTPSAAVAMNASPWIQAVVSYQQLYSRESVAAHGVADAEPSKGVVEAIRREDRLPLRVPDLREVGLTFAHIQRLRFHGRPLIQIECLPKDGPPIALCVIKEVKPDHPITAQHVADMDVIAWRQSELAYALIGAHSGLDLASIGKQIADQSTDELYGEARPSDLALLAR